MTARLRTKNDDLLRPRKPTRTSLLRAYFTLAAIVLQSVWQVWAAESTSGPGTEAGAVVPIERLAYRVSVNVSFENSILFDTQARRQMISELRDAIDRSVGQLWNVTVSECRWLAGGDASTLDRLESLPAEDADPGERPDKNYVLTFQAPGSDSSISGREWDSMTRQISPGSTRYCQARAELGTTALRVLRDLFRPVALVEFTRNGPLRLRVRGGAFRTPDQAWQPVERGRLFEPWFLYLNKSREIERIQTVPWTYLTAGEPEFGVADVQIDSGLRGALAARRRRIQTVALGVAARGTQTEVILATRGPGGRAIAGALVEVAHSRPATDEGGEVEPTSKPQELYSDRNGRITVSGERFDKTPVWLSVRSGQALLAKVPLVPGLHPRQTLELPDDSIRLEVEGELALLQARLVDAVARRAILAATARARAKAQAFDAAKQLLNQLDEMPKPQAFAAELNRIRVPALKAARQRRDRLSEARIVRLCDDTSEMIAHYLDSERLRELRDEIEEITREAAEESAVEKRDR